MGNKATATQMELTRLSEIIDSIYQGATEPAHWNNVVPQIADYVGAQRGFIFTPLNTLENGGYYFSHKVPEGTMQLLGTRYQEHDLWASRSVELGLMCDGNVVNGDDIVPFEEYSRSIIYRELLSKIDSAHLLGGVIFGVGSEQQTPTSAIALHRGVAAGRFHAHEGERLGLLLPHLSRALGVMTRLRDLEFRIAASLAALEHLNTGVLLFNAKGTVTFANQAARRVLEEEDGLQLRHLIGSSDLGELIANKRKVQETLSAAIRNAVTPDLLHTEHFSRAVPIPRPSGHQDYLLNFSSLATNNEFGSGPEAPRAIAFITDSTVPIRLDAGLMKQTYGLTPAEVRVAEMLAECLTVEETAEKMSLSPSTVKVHQKHIYEKIGINNRSKLMKLLMSLAQVKQ